MKPVPGKIQCGPDVSDHEDLTAAVATGRYEGGRVYDESGTRLKGEIQRSAINWEVDTVEYAEAFADRVQAFCDELQSNIVWGGLLPEGDDCLPNGLPITQPAAVAQIIARRFDGLVGGYYAEDNPEARRMDARLRRHDFALVGPLVHPGCRRLLVDFSAKQENSSEQWIYDLEIPEDAQKARQLYGPTARWDSYAPQKLGRDCVVYHAILPAGGVPVDYFDEDDFIEVNRVNSSFPELAVRLTSADDPNWKIALSREEAASQGRRRGTEVGDVIVCAAIPYAVLPEGEVKMVPTKKMFDLRKKVDAHVRQLESIAPTPPQTVEPSAAPNL